jgi:REP element-mobilizing transposase RayT
MPPDEPHRLYVHLAWTTLARVPSLQDSRRASIESHLLAACRWLGVEPVETCVMADRVHLLARIPAALPVADLAARTRAAVEELLGAAGQVVHWSRDFAAVTVSPRDVRRVRRRLASLGLGLESAAPLPPLHRAPVRPPVVGSREWSDRESPRPG